MAQEQTEVELVRKAQELKADGKRLGRIKIFTSESAITRDNLISVLRKAYRDHDENRRVMQFLIDYDRGVQPLPRVKRIRPDIDIRTTSALPNYIKRFKKGYNWGSPVLLIQRGDVEVPEKDARKDDVGISMLNEHLKNVENIGCEDSEMAEFIEVCGIGHRMIDVRGSQDFDDSGSLLHLYTLDSRFAFVVYYDGPGQRKMLGVTFSSTTNNKKRRFTCFTDDRRYEVEGDQIISDEINILGRIPIIEYERAVDRTGCFERAIPLIDLLNAMESDLANDAAQRTQEIWWGNDIDFKTDEAGNPIAPKSGQWVLSYSGENLNPKIAPLSSTFPQSAVQESISVQRKTILQECFVPIQYETAGGGSTGTATDMSSGWSAAELDASLEQMMTERGKREEVQLILRALRFVPISILPSDSPMRQIKASDIDFHFNRKRNYDLTNKANFVVSMIGAGFNGRHVLSVADVFPDNEQAWLDSKEKVEAFQDSRIGDEGNSRLQADNSDQVTNSPFIDGLGM